MAQFYCLTYVFIGVIYLVTDDSIDSGHATWEATINEGLEATKIAGNALNALTPIHDNGVAAAGEVGKEGEEERNKSNSMISEDEELLL